MEFIITIFSSAVVTTVLISIITWLSKTWIKERLSRSIKHEYDTDLEQYKSDLSANNAVAIEQFKARIGTEYEIIKASLLRYSEKQFDIYNDLWASLCDLEVSVNRLWEQANIINLRKLSKQVHDAKLKVRKSALLIEDKHYKELNYILKEFEGFQFGKQNLIDLRKTKRNEHIDQYEIENAISNNAEIKNRLVTLLAEMMECLKRQIIKKEETNNNCINNRS